MKKMSLMLLAIFAIAVASYAQGGFQRPSIEDRVKRVHTKIDSAFKLDAAKLAATDSTFAGYYRAQDAKRDELRASGSTDRDAMMAEMKKLTDARDEKLKAILTEEQFKIWKEQIEPSMRPQRPPGGGGN